MQTRQGLIDDAFRDLNVLQYYINDFLTASLDRESHLKNLDLVCQQHQKHNYGKWEILNPDDPIYFLGHTSEAQVIHIVGNKVLVIPENPKWTTAKWLQMFNGLIKFALSNLSF